jgi:uncharacterized protein
MNNDNNFNKLSHEKSLYLQKAASHQVNWHPFNGEALEAAKLDNLPIYVHIGRFTNFWGKHFLDDLNHSTECIEFLNKNFKCFLVDALEMPDFDEYCQKAAQLYSQSAGHPLHAFMTPGLKPFFAGHSFMVHRDDSKDAPFPQNDFLGLLKELFEAYQNNPKLVEDNSIECFNKIMEGSKAPEKIEYPGHFPSPVSILKAVEQFQDNENGGYGEDPKFPQFTFLEWSLEQILEGKVNNEEGKHIIDTLESMLMGGIYDHARGGAHPYSVDKNWLTPYFEKNIFTQAAMLKVLAKLSLILPTPIIYDHLIQTLDYIKSEMLSDDQFFFTAQSPDAENVNGGHHTFTEDEFVQAIKEYSKEESKLGERVDEIKSWFGITKDGDTDYMGNIIHLKKETLKDIFSPETWETIREVKNCLFMARKKRIPPLTDTQGVAPANFQMILGLVDVMQYCRIEYIRNMAADIFNQAMEGVFKTFIQQNTEDQKMRIVHSTTRHEAIPYFEDYLFFTETQLRVYEMTANPVFKENAKQTLIFIENEFFKDNLIYTRSTKADDLLPFPNLFCEVYDHNYRSPLMVLLGLVKRMTVLFPDEEFFSKGEELTEWASQFTLRNPLNAGEGLRSLTYPIESYRRLEVPSSWPSDQTFLKLIPYFLPRFVISYHEEGQEWKIFNHLNECEISGEGVESFQSTLVPVEGGPSEDGE